MSKIGRLIGQLVLVQLVLALRIAVADAFDRSLDFVRLFLVMFAILYEVFVFFLLRKHSNLIRITRNVWKYLKVMRSLKAQ